MQAHKLDKNRMTAEKSLNDDDLAWIYSLYSNLELSVINLQLYLPLLAHSVTDHILKPADVWYGKITVLKLRKRFRGYCFDCYMVFTEVWSHLRYHWKLWDTTQIYLVQAPQTMLTKDPSRC